MLHFAFIVWNANPDFIELGALTIRWYGLLYAAAFFIGYKIIKNIYKTEKLDGKEVDRLTWHAVIGIIIGARLGFMILHSQDANIKSYWHNPSDILMVWQGGLSSYGAAVGLLIAIYIYTRKGKVRSFLWVMDKMILPVVLGGFFVRMGNLFNSEIYGIQTNLPWGFKFVKDIANAGKKASEIIPHHPTQIYEGLLFLCLYFFLSSLYKRKRKVFVPGTLFGISLICLYGIRFCIEFIKEPQISFNYMPLVRYGINMNHFLCLPFILSGAFLLVYTIRVQKQKTA